MLSYVTATNMSPMLSTKFTPLFFQAMYIVLSLFEYDFYPLRTAENYVARMYHSSKHLPQNVQFTQPIRYTKQS